MVLWVLRSLRIAQADERFGLRWPWSPDDALPGSTDPTYGKLSFRVLFMYRIQVLTDT
jgi:hypothetical protein